MSLIPPPICVTIFSVQVSVGYQLCATVYNESQQLSEGARDARVQILQKNAHLFIHSFKNHLVGSTTYQPWYQKREYKINQVAMFVFYPEAPKEDNDQL